MAKGHFPLIKLQWKKISFLGSTGVEGEETAVGICFYPSKIRFPGLSRLGCSWLAGLVPGDTGKPGSSTEMKCQIEITCVGLF